MCRGLGKKEDEEYIIKKSTRIVVHIHKEVEMYSTSNGNLVHRSNRASQRYIGPPGMNSRMTPLGNVDYNGCFSGECGASAPMWPVRYCFQPAFQVPEATCKLRQRSGAVDPYVESEGGGNDATQNCVWSAESRRFDLQSYAKSSTGLSNSAIMAPRSGAAAASSISAFCSDNAMVIQSISPYDLNLIDDSFSKQLPNGLSSPILILRTSDGTKVAALPIRNDVSVEPQLQQAMLGVWQPERFAESNKPDAHALATSLRDTCFFKDVRYPDGTLLPLAVRATPKCIAAAQAAWQQVYPSMSACACFAGNDNSSSSRIRRNPTS